MNEQPPDPGRRRRPDPSSPDPELPLRRISRPQIPNVPHEEEPEDFEMETRLAPAPEIPPEELTPARPSPPVSTGGWTPLAKPEDMPSPTYGTTIAPAGDAVPPARSTTTSRERIERRRQRRMARERRDSGLYLPWWSLLILLAVVAFFITLVLLGVNLFTGQGSTGGETPVIIIITSTPTPQTSARPTLRPSPTSLFAPQAASPDTAGSPTVPALLSPGETPATTPEAPSEQAQTTPIPQGNIQIGVTVQVANVEGVPLNIREGPGRSATPRFLATEGFRFRVIGGPEEADDLVWWQVQDLENPARQGWAAQDFLAVVTE